jgi:hypothetical protein
MSHLSPKASTLEVANVTFEMTTDTLEVSVAEHVCAAGRPTASPTVRLRLTPPAFSSTHGGSPSSSSAFWSSITPPTWPSLKRFSTSESPPLLQSCSLRKCFR